MLNDTEIERLSMEIGLITPYNKDQQQPASYDLLLGMNLLLPYSENVLKLYPKQRTIPEYLPRYTPFTLAPGTMILGSTVETLSLPNNLHGKFEGKSSLGRMGLMTHITAGFVDPGFHGVLTVEIFNAGPWWIVLEFGMKIGQIIFTPLIDSAKIQYGHPALGSHYQNSITTEGAR